MDWTVERFLNEWDVLLAPLPWVLEALESPARNLVASYAITAFELRKEVTRCRAWKNKSTEQIDEDFMRKVIVPLVRMNPLVGGDGELIPWNYNYQDPRGPKPLAPKEELEVILSYLHKKLPKLSRELEIYEAANIDEPVVEIKNSLIAHKILIREVSDELRRKEADRLGLVIEVHKAMQRLGAVGIPCEKVVVDMFWIKLVATVWGVEPNSIYSVARKAKKLRRQ